MWTISSFFYRDKKYTCDSVSFYLKISYNFMSKFTFLHHAIFIVKAENVTNQHAIISIT